MLFNKNLSAVAWAPSFFVFPLFVFSVLVKLTGLNPALPYNFLHPTFLYYRRGTTVMAIRIFILKRTLLPRCTLKINNQYWLISVRYLSNLLLCIKKIIRLIPFEIRPPWVKKHLERKSLGFLFAWFFLGCGAYHKFWGINTKVKWILGYAYMKKLILTGVTKNFQGRAICECSLRSLHKFQS